MLVLLIIFMVAAPLPPSISAVELPASAVEPQPVRTSRVRHREPDLSVAVGEDMILRDRSRHARHRQQGQKMADLSPPDKAVSYGDLMEVMNLLRNAAI